jgi:hypothetical protein
VVIAVERHPDLASAIRRSRSARKAWRNRRRRSVAIAAALSIALGGAGILSLEAMTGADVVHAAVAHAQSLSDLLGQRSPGQRTEAQLTKTSRARPLAKALARPRSHSPAKPPVLLASILMAPPGEGPVDVALPGPFSGAPLAAAAIFLPAPGIGGIGSLPGGGGAIVSPPGGGTGSPPGSLPPVPHQPGPSAVPEPGTWALMLLGFGLIGWRAKRAGQALPTA